MLIRSKGLISIGRKEEIKYAHNGQRTVALINGTNTLIKVRERRPP